ncbi:YggS family pyridoxal phosphate-dependent enzyme [Microcella sp.]|uniref:YggS family pyridoxal phosphate-dependent enzyme n=1 Tax=Microcella sp. TaxID=1913979 RepID=UPI002566A857|nr:YggS family pyridoxal phosphate-dependent enzyme [Microcella sp.]MBX9470697.1 YggS family pyridoxal phosphate-dependent enzyme [Microcella sp.]MBX9470702.1 YggS family pyridoxal phosphate-dependent enzyme [Microcella sp.]
MTEIDPQLADRYATVSQGIAEACRSAGRSIDEITTVVVTKFHPASLIEQLAAMGVTDVGENRHQDAAPKAAALAALPLTWHFVGQLQSNKARAVTEYARVIHSVDRSSLVTALAKVERPIDVFLEVNLTDDSARGGVEPGEVLRLAETVLVVPTLRLLGVMAVAPLDEPARAAFGRLRAISDELRALAPHASQISAGMSGDYAEAIAEGATHLRIGAAITGKRPAQP